MKGFPAALAVKAPVAASTWTVTRPLSREKVWPDCWARTSAGAGASAKTLAAIAMMTNAAQQVQGLVIFRPVDSDRDYDWAEQVSSKPALGFG
jgi:hypothetical protein